MTQAMARLQTLGIVKETTGKQRRQIFAYHAYWKLISRGMDKAD
jgi:hypothetical protein